MVKGVEAQCGTEQGRARGEGARVASDPDPIVRVAAIGRAAEMGPAGARAARQVGRPSLVLAFRKAVIVVLAAEPNVMSSEVVRRMRERGYSGGKSALYGLIAALRSGLTEASAGNEVRASEPAERVAQEGRADGAGSRLRAFPSRSGRDQGGRDRQPMLRRRRFSAWRMRDIRRGTGGGRIQMLELAEHAYERFQATGGRPSSPEWEIRRLVPFRPVSWGRLRALGHEVGLSAGQLVALLVERDLLTLAWQGGPADVTPPINEVLRRRRERGGAWPPLRAAIWEPRRREAA